MLDASDSDEVSKRLGLKNYGSRVDTSDSDGVCGGGVDNFDGNLLEVEVAIGRKNIWNDLLGVDVANGMLMVTVSNDIICETN